MMKTRTPIFACLTTVLWACGAPEAQSTEGENVSESRRGPGDLVSLGSCLHRTPSASCTEFLARGTVDTEETRSWYKGCVQPIRYGDAVIEGEWLSGGCPDRLDDAERSPMGCHQAIDPAGVVTERWTYVAEGFDDPRARAECERARGLPVTR